VCVVDVECGIFGIHSDSVAIGNVNDRAAAKFSKGVKGVVVSRSEAGRARAIEHLYPEGDPLSKFLKILGSKKRLFWTPEIRGVDPFSGFIGEKRVAAPFFGTEKVRLPVFRQNSRKFHFLRGSRTGARAEE